MLTWRASEKTPPVRLTYLQRAVHMLDVRQPGKPKGRPRGSGTALLRLADAELHGQLAMMLRQFAGISTGALDGVLSGADVGSAVSVLLELLEDEESVEDDESFEYALALSAHFEATLIVLPSG